MKGAITLYMSNLDVRSNLQGPTAPTMKSWHHIHLKETQNCQILTHLCWCNSVRVYLYDCGHRWKWKVLQHFIYIQYGCEKKLTVVYSLNHDMMASFPLNSDPHFISVTRVHIHIWLQITLKGDKHYWMREAISSGLQPQTYMMASFPLDKDPELPKSDPFVGVTV